MRETVLDDEIRVRLGKALKKKAMLKAIKEDTKISKVVRSLLEAWLRGQIKTP